MMGVKMKKLFILVTIFLSLLLAVPSQAIDQESILVAALDDFFGAGNIDDFFGAGDMSKFLGVDVASATCDTTNMDHFWTAEDLDFSATNSDECDLGDVVDGDDCGDTDETWTGASGATTTTDAVKYGSKGLDLIAAFDYATAIPPSTIDDEGRMGFWLRMTVATDTAKVVQFVDDPSDYWHLVLVGDDTPELRVVWADGDAPINCDTSSAGLSEGTWFYIEFAWKPATNLVKIYVNGSEKGSCSASITAMTGGGAGSWHLGDGSGTAKDFHYDNIILVTDSTQDLYSTCSATETYPNS
jgi:hypothetical protein